MAFRLRRSETVADGVRRIIREEIDSAAAGLRELSDPITAVHEARKSVKKVRALLRLLSPGLAEPFGAANIALRDASRRLSHLRDADVMVQTADALAQRFVSANLDDLRQRILASRKSTPARVATAAANAMQRAVASSSEWQIGEEWPALSRGLEATFRKGRLALANAEKSPTVESLHHLRKRVKDHWYHMRLLQPLWTEVLATREKNLKSIETWLGENHNLAVLQERHPAPEQMIAEYRKELEDSALKLAKSIYADKPRVFVEQIRELWDAWKAKPTERAHASAPRKQHRAA